MLIYPNHMSFPIMEGGGIPPPPQGMLTIRVLRADKLKGGGTLDKIDPFVEVCWHPGLQLVSLKSVLQLLHASCEIPLALPLRVLVNPAVC